ncbi:MAG: recombinase family protein [Raoultibacter sp.]
MKRVYCLYRVSTAKQVEKDDIPMQKQSCHEFVDEQSDWKITKEFSEKGISGFKVSAKDRDAIQDLQKAALENKFDVLLVFMFDRIGRKEDETPFVVEWFTQHGVEVWSVKEGQQRFDNHVDKLMNYIRYWQASGESVKTSVRTKTRMGQIVKEGRFKGGVAPFGYQLVHNGRVNKRGHEVYDLEICEREASIVRLIFDRHANAGMGPQSIASFLTSQGITNRAGKNFVAPTIKSIIANPMYRGILRCGDSMSEPFDHLRIIDDATFFRSQELIKQRADKYQEQRRVPRKVTSSCLLTGNIFCGHCGARLITSTSGAKRTRSDGSVSTRRWWRYVCYNRIRHKDECCGQTGYVAEHIDAAITEVVCDLLDRLKKVPMSTIVEKRYGIEVKNLELELKTAQAALSKKTSEWESLKAEVVNSIRGESSFEPALLNEILETTAMQKDSTAQTVERLKDELAASKSLVAPLKQQHDRFVSWADIYSNCDINTKRMIVCQLIDKVTVSRGYDIDIKLSITMQQYQEYLDDGSSRKSVA